MAPALGLIAIAGGWWTLWSVESFWNPLAFTALWTGAALLMWSLTRRGYPGLTAHLELALLSVPLWWWFELVNARVQNWEYVVTFDYSTVERALMTSLAFSTVVPALSAATLLAQRLVRPVALPAPSHGPRLGVQLIVAGALIQVATLMLPVLFYPFVWIAPLLVLDGLVVRAGGRSLVRDLAGGHWRRAAAIALAGLMCGLLWEFWNFWASPKWVYDVPLFGFAKIFEMPVLGYGGYIPFAWSVAQLVRWVGLIRGRAPRA